MRLTIYTYEGCKFLSHTPYLKLACPQAIIKIKHKGKEKRDSQLPILEEEIPGETLEGGT